MPWPDPQLSVQVLLRGRNGLQGHETERRAGEMSVTFSHQYLVFNELQIGMRVEHTVTSAPEGSLLARTGRLL